MSIKYKNPPINELVFGVYFDREITQLRAEHIGLFWSRIKKEFNSSNQNAPVPRPLVAGEFINQLKLEFMQMPRIILNSEDNSFVLQIQQNAFFFNWRRRENVYPHFENVRDKFNSIYLKFLNFLNEENIEVPNIQMMELYCVNLINVCEYWNGIDDTTKVIPNFKNLYSSKVNEDYVGFNYSTTQKIEKNFNLTTTIRSDQSSINPGEPALIVELRMLGVRDQDDDNYLSFWFEGAHKKINASFINLTDSDIQNKHWLQDKI